MHTHTHTHTCTNATQIDAQSKDTCRCNCTHMQPHMHTHAHAKHTYANTLAHTHTHTHAISQIGLHVCSICKHIPTHDMNTTHHNHNIIKWKHSHNIICKLHHTTNNYKKTQKKQMILSNLIRALFSHNQMVTQHKKSKKQLGGALS